MFNIYEPGAIQQKRLNLRVERGKTSKTLTQRWQIWLPTSWQTSNASISEHNARGPFRCCWGRISLVFAVPPVPIHLGLQCCGLRGIHGGLVIKHIVKHIANYSHKIHILRGVTHSFYRFLTVETPKRCHKHACLFLPAKWEKNINLSWSIWSSHLISTYLIMFHPIGNTSNHRRRIQGIQPRRSARLILRTLVSLFKLKKPPGRCTACKLEKTMQQNATRSLDPVILSQFRLLQIGKWSPCKL